MQNGLKIAFFGSSLVSAYWNGAATYYRGIIKELHHRGHNITFYEPDAYERQSHRDIDDPDWAQVVVYPNTQAGVDAALDDACQCDLMIKASGVGVFDEYLEYEIPLSRRNGATVAFWDVDAPATLERLEQNASDPFHQLIPNYDLILTYGGGYPVTNAYRRLGARRCAAIYNALDPSTHHPVAADPKYFGDLGFLGNRLPDRESRVENYFLRAAECMPQGRFLLGGSGWHNKQVPANVIHLGHVYTRDHNVFNSSVKAVLNISRDSMARFGYCPATRVFEAAGAGACIITDWWEGIEMFLEPGQEIVITRDGYETAELLERLSAEDSRRIGAKARERVLSEHTYARRAAQVEVLLTA
jgi:spore maturation protein CgeB